jgi:hypothetical protein
MLLLVRPTRRGAVYDAYWSFAAERHAIFSRRVAGQSAPWTSDPILLEFKFCNVFRASDRVSQALIRRVACSSEDKGLAPEDVFLRVILFRLFSKERTWDLIEAATGGLRRASFDVQKLGDWLEDARRHGPIYTSAFILAPDPTGACKHRSHLALVDAMFRPGRLGRDLALATSLRGVYQALLAWPLIGPFLAYQIAIDLNYTEHLDFDEDDFTMPGPGALRGLRKVFSDFGGSTPGEIVHLMVDRQEEEFDRLGLAFDGLFGRRLHAIDCQGLFCEVDKYSRRAFPALKSERVRIKQRFTASPEPLPLFYPPKWQINQKLGPQMEPALQQQLMLGV